MFLNTMTFNPAGSFLSEFLIKIFIFLLIVKAFIVHEEFQV